eukprot:2709822-Prymnesium_polylepis.1
MPRRGAKGGARAEGGVVRCCSVLFGVVRCCSVLFGVVRVAAGALRHAREHVLQAVARLVEESRHLVESHQARLAVSGRRAVAREVRDLPPTRRRPRSSRG